MLLNDRRRHLDERQHGVVAARIANITHGQNQHTLRSAILPVQPIRQSDAAEMLNVSERTVRSARTVIDEGAPELVAAVETGRVAADVAALPKAQQTEIVAHVDLAAATQTILQMHSRHWLCTLPCQSR